MRTSPLARIRGLRRTRTHPTVLHAVARRTIYYRAQVLSEFPRIGHRYEVHPDREVRILLYGHYRIAYLLKHDRDIDILGVFHGAMEIERYIK